jgi:hypothetical protein
VAVAPLITPLLLRLASVTGPFDAGTVVELKLVVEGESPAGELYLRVPAQDQPKFFVGDVWAIRLIRV